MGALIFLAGLVALLLILRKISARLALLEQQVEYLQQAGRSAEPAVPAAAADEPVRPAWVVPPVEPETEPEPEPVEPVRETLATLFERFVAGRLLIWIGGISLAVAGVFLVRYSIEIGLITPPVRMILAGLFGLVLLGAGEAARLRPSTSLGMNELNDPRIAQALVGAGIFVLYAAVYGSLTLYGLIGLGTASALMTLITAAALALSLRHGAPTAVMGLAGGFLTPLLVGDPEAGALTLLIYLALLNAALFWIAGRRGWGWLAIAAVLASFAWTGLLLADPDRGDALMGGAFIVLLSVAASLLRTGERGAAIVRPAAIGLVQLAILVGREDIGLPAWLLFGMLAGAGLFLSTRRPELRLLPPLALLLALVLLGMETAGGAEPTTPIVAAAITLLFAGFAMPAALRTGTFAATALAAAALALPAVIMRAFDPGLLPPAGWAGVMSLLALASGWLVWAQRRLADSERLSPPLLTAGAATGLLLALALNDLLPTRGLPAAWLVLALGAALAGQRLGDCALRQIAFAIVVIAIVGAVLLVPDLWLTAAASLAGDPAFVADLPAPGRAIIVLLVPAAMLLALIRSLRELRQQQRIALAIAAFALLLAGLYVPAKQIFALDEANFVARGLAERTLITQALFVAGWLLAGRGRAGLATLGRALTVLAAFRFVWFDLIVHNPALTRAWVGALPLLNLLLPAYLASAFWLYAARRRDPERSGAWLALALMALIAGVMLIVRQLFQGAILSGPGVPRGEFYGYSLAGLLLAIALLAGGIRLPDKALRVAGLALLTATIVKVFLIDAGALEGLLRVLSFLGLGVALIGVGKLYAKVLGAERVAAA